MIAPDSRAPDHRARFLELALRAQALRFGAFTLKSGRESPYFFNAGLFNDGAALAELGQPATPTRWTHRGVGFDMLFGPAYKGIPLRDRAGLRIRPPRPRPAAGLQPQGSQGPRRRRQLIGAPLAGRVLIVDDVITAGTAIREALGIIREVGGTPAGVVIALDRQERGQRSARAVRGAGRRR